MRKTFYRTRTSILLFIFLFLFANSVVFGQQQTKPNILIIFSDDHAYQAISAYGSKLAQTPNIDRIAKDGAVFKNVFVTNSLCAPSRAVLLTGKYSHVNGLKVNNINNPFDIKQQLVTRILQQNNYQTAWIGKWHLQTLPGDAFNYWMVPPDQGDYYNPDFINMQNDTARINGYITEVISDLAFDWLDNKRDKSKPFFLVIGEKATHREWLPDLQDLGAYDAINFPLPKTLKDNYEGRIAAAHQDMTIAKTMRLKEDLKVHVEYGKTWPYHRFTPEQQKVFSDYYENKVSKEFDEHHYTGDSLLRWKYQRYLKDYLSVARSLDRNIGKVLDYLDKNNLTENTVVIYASDQGFYMGEHGWFDKRFMYEESFRTPFIMKYPGVIKPGSTVNNMVVNIDFAPTILDIAGVKLPDDMQGQSFLPILKNKEYKWRDAVYYHYYEYPQPHHVSPHFGIRTSQYKLIRFYGPADAWELYDLKTDANELHNLYGKKEYTSIIEKLKKQLNELVEKYDDKGAADILEKDSANKK
ncbi:MAG: sulfatase [Chitinophagaceae bacterium]